MERQQQEFGAPTGPRQYNKPTNEFFDQARNSAIDISRSVPDYRTKTLKPGPERIDPFLTNNRIYSTPPTTLSNFNRHSTRQTDQFLNQNKFQASPTPDPAPFSRAPAGNGRYSAAVLGGDMRDLGRSNARASDSPALVPQPSPEPPKPEPRKHRPSDMIRPLPFDPLAKRPKTEPTDPVVNNQLKSRYPGLKTNIDHQVNDMPNPEPSLSSRRAVHSSLYSAPSDIPSRYREQSPEPQAQLQEIMPPPSLDPPAMPAKDEPKFKAFDPAAFKPSQQIWSMGDFGTGVNEILKNSIMQSESIPIPTKSTLPTPSTTTTTTTTTTTRPPTTRPPTTTTTTQRPKPRSRLPPPQPKKAQGRSRKRLRMRNIENIKGKSRLCLPLCA